jgi:hypothetical protein
LLKALGNDPDQIHRSKPLDIQELEEMVAKLLETARKLPAGPVRNDILKEIGKFTARIAALKAKK